jgi:two-component system sensor histidine kinase YesM
LAQLNDQDVIASMVQALGDLLRASIGSKRPVIPLAEEMQLLRQYVLIQKLRYGERLQVGIELPDSLGTVAVPKLALQPFVENSIKYGLEASAAGCRILVAAEERADHVAVTVRDDGPGMEPCLMEQIREGLVEPRGSGVGIKNIQDRIAQVYGDEGSLCVESAPGSGVVVTLLLPRLTVQELAVSAGLGG